MGGRWMDSHSSTHSFLLFSLFIVAIATAPPSGGDGNTPCNVPAGGNVVIISSCTMPAGVYYPASFMINAPVTVHITANETSGEGVTIITSSFIVADASAIISAKGYKNDSGPGKGTAKPLANLFGGGGSHAGRGNYNYNHPNHLPYGDFARPVSLGSGGGSCTAAAKGGQGGGAIKIITSTFANAGIIDVSGTDGVSAGDVGQGGGGSGGSIWIECDTLEGVGSLKINGGNFASHGRAALYFNTSNDATPDFFNAPFVAISGNIASSGTFYMEYGTEFKLKALYSLGYDIPMQELMHSAYFAATVLSKSATNYTFDSITLPYSGKLVIGSELDTLTLVEDTVLTGYGVVFVAGTLLVHPDAGVLSSTSLSFGVLPGGKAILNGDIVLTQSTFYNFGTLSGVKNILLTTSGLYLGAEGNTENMPKGSYNFTNVILDMGASIIPTYYNLATIGAVQINAANVTLSGYSRIDASGQGYPYDYGTGKGMPSTSDGPSGGGGGHGGRGLTWLRYPQFSLLPVDSNYYQTYYKSDFLTNTTWGTTYGSYTSPSTPGSGGGKFGYHERNIYDPDAIPALRCQGGGAVHLVIRSSLTLSESNIHANGMDYVQPGSPFNVCGGGAGGSIWVELASNTLFSTSDAIISADGGGMGGGGRIAIYSEDLSLTDTNVRALGKNVHAYGGSPGTVYLNDLNNGLLYIQNADIVPPIPGTFGSEEHSAVAHLQGGAPAFPTHRIIVENNASLSFVPEPAVLFDPAVMPNILIGQDGLLHWHGLVALSTFSSETNPLTTSIAAHKGSTVTLGTQLYVNAFLLIDGAVHSADIIVMPRGTLHIGPNGYTTGQDVATYNFVSVNVTAGQLVFRPDFNEEKGIIVPHLKLNALGIFNGGKIHSDYMGFRSMRGPLPGLRNEASGGHAGRGKNLQPTYMDNTPMIFGYGDVVYPETMGSGGAPKSTGDTSIPYIAGGAGGGAVHITTKSIINKGVISAVGQGHAGQFSALPGMEIPSGAGGSVWIDCSQCSTIDDFGGKYDASGALNTIYGSSGGRVSLLFHSNGTATAGANGLSGGAPGTVFINGTQDPFTGLLFVTGDGKYADFPPPATVVNSKVLVPGANLIQMFGINSAAFEIAENNYVDFMGLITLSMSANDCAMYVSGTVRNPPAGSMKGLYVRESGNLTFASSDITFFNQYVHLNGTILGLPEASATITVTGTSFLGLGSKVVTSGYPGEFIVKQITVENNLKFFCDLGSCPEVRVDLFGVSGSGAVNADYNGWQEGTGPSPAFQLGGNNCTAGHASSGSCGWGQGPGLNGRSYGDFARPIEVGSGGGLWNGNLMGSGGGAIKITANHMNIQGTISVRGGAYASAGSIYLTATASLGGTGTLLACSDGGYGSKRSNGRVAVYSYNAGTFTGTVCAGTAYYFEAGDERLVINPQADLEDMPVELASPQEVNINKLEFPSNFSVLSNRVNLYVITPFTPNSGTILNYGTLETPWRLEIRNINNYYELIVDKWVISGTAKNYGAVYCRELSVNSVGRLYLMSDVDPHLGYYFDGMTWHSLTAGTVVVAVNATIEGKVIFNRPLDPYSLHVRPSLLAFALNIAATANVNADAQGLPNTDIGCYGGSNAGHSGGYTIVDDIIGDNINPITYGGTGGICNETQPTPSTSDALGGGAIRLVAVNLVISSPITADGQLGGAGGSIWIQTSRLKFTGSGTLSANGQGDPSGYECGGGGRVSYTYASVIAYPAIPASYTCVTSFLQPGPGSVYFRQFPFVVQNNMAFWSPFESALKILQVSELAAGNIMQSRKMPASFRTGTVYNLKSDWLDIEGTEQPNSYQFTYAITNWTFANGSTSLRIEFEGATLNWSTPEQGTQSPNALRFINNINIPYVVWDTVLVQVVDIRLDTVLAPPVALSVSPNQRTAYLTVPRFNNKVEITFGLLKDISALGIVPVLDTVAQKINGGAPEGVIVITGSNFGSLPGSVTFAGDQIGPVLVWNNTYIEVVGPGVNKSGKVLVITSGGAVNTPNKTLTVHTTPPEHFEPCSVISYGHFIQHNTQKFDFQSRGEFVLSKLLGRSVETQIRLELAEKSTRLTAVALQFYSITFEVGLADPFSNQPLPLFMNGLPFPLTTIPLYDPTSFTPIRIFTHEYVNVTYTPTPPSYMFYHSDGSIEVFSGFTWLGVNTVVNQAAESSSYGICGNLIPVQLIKGDLTAITIAGPSFSIAQSTLVDFAESWRVTNETSLFKYFYGQTYETNNPRNFFAIYGYPPVNITSMNIYVPCLELISGDVGSMGIVCPNSGIVPYFYYAACVSDIWREAPAKYEPATAWYAQACHRNLSADFTSRIMYTYSFVYGAGLAPLVPVNTYNNFTYVLLNALGLPSIGGASAMFNPNPNNRSTSYNAGRYETTYIVTTTGTLQSYIYFGALSGDIRGATFISQVTNVPNTISCRSWGDPHISTFTGITYTTQGYAEYLLYQDGDLVVQIRQSECGIGFTCNSAVAVRYRSVVVGVYMIDSRPNIYVDGSILSELPYSHPVENLLIQATHPWEFGIEFPHAFIRIKHYDNTWLDISINVMSQNGSFIQDGLCGVIDKALTSRVGKFTLGPKPSSYDYHQYAQYLAVNASSSLFDYYITDSSFETYNQLAYASNYVYQPNAASGLCELLSGEGGALAECEEFVSPIFYYQSCLQDVSSFGGPNPVSRAQSSIVAYAEMCNQYTQKLEGFTVIPGHTTADGPGVQPTGQVVGNQTYLVLHPHDALGNPMPQISSINVALRVNGITINSSTTIISGLVLVNFSFSVNGTVHLSVQVSSVDVWGSPFELIVTGNAPTPTPTSTPTNAPTQPPVSLPLQVPCAVWGGSHFTLFSGRTITYKGYGELLFASFEFTKVQVRQAPCGNSSCITAVAVTINSTVVEFYVINNAIVPFVNSTKVANLPTLVGKYLLQNRSSVAITLSLDQGYLNAKLNLGNLDVSVYVSTDGQNTQTPLLGGTCGVLGDVLNFGNGTIFSTPTQKSLLEFIPSWKLNETTSVFNYSVTNSSFVQSNIPGYIGIYNHTFKDPSIFSWAIQTCSILKEDYIFNTCSPAIITPPFYEGCMEDIAASGAVVSGDSSIIIYTLMCHNIVKTPVLVLPTVAVLSYADGPGLLGAIAGQQTWLAVHPMDPRWNTPDFPATFVVTIQGPSTFAPINVPGNLSAPSYNVSFTPLISGTHKISIKYLGADIYGSPFTVTVTKDPTCANCGTGYTCINSTCQDLNECLLTQPVCTAEQVCYNTPGSYICQGCDGGCNSPQGVCVAGVCICSGNYTGPRCESAPIPVNYTHNETSPVINIIPSGNYSRITFRISIKEVREIDPSNVILKQERFSELNFTSTYEDDSTWVYNTTFPNLRGALAINFSTTAQARNISFAGQSFTLVPNALKFSVNISAWRFTSARNRLVLVTQAEILAPTDDPCKVASTSTKTLDDNLVWVTSQYEGVTLYGRFLSMALADGKIIDTQNIYNGTAGESYIVLPHFYNEAIIDPDFSVLVDPTHKDDPCGTKAKSNRGTKVATIVATTVVLSVAALCAVAYVIYRRRMRANTRKRINAAHASSSKSLTQSQSERDVTKKTSLLSKVRSGFSSRKHPKSNPLYNSKSNMNPLYTDEAL